MKRRLADYHRSLIAGETDSPGRWLQRSLLRLSSFPYGWAVALRNRAYDRKYLPTHKAEVPVISVGNLTVGGTGKTPFVEYLARWFDLRQTRVAILSRGYGRPLHRRNFSQWNDEALVLRDNLPGVPHLQGTDRVASARLAVAEYQAQVLLLDDGFQHRRLARDLEVVMLDATNPWGQNHLLPRGLLREPVDSLNRATLIVLSRCDQTDVAHLNRLRDTVAWLAPSASLVETVHRPHDLVNADLDAAPIEPTLNKPVIAFCGLGNPRAFQQTLEGLGTRLLGFRSYADHHAYTVEDIRDLQNWIHAQPPGCVAVTSQKDLVKLRRTHLGGRELWALRVRLEVVNGQDELERRLLPLAVRVAGSDARAA